MNQCETRFDFGMLVMLSSAISFEVEFCAKDSEAVAALAWNFQWDTILLSVILESEVNLPILKWEHENGSSCYKSRNSHIYPALFRSSKIINDEVLDEFLSIRASLPKLMESAQFSHALGVAGAFFRESRISTKVALCWSGIEALIDIKHELRFRNALYIAALLGRSSSERKDIFENAKRLYDGRSRCVHGSGFNSKKDENDIATGSMLILKSLIVYCLQSGRVPEGKELDEIVLGL